MELKLETPEIKSGADMCSNCTFMELKHKKGNVFTIEDRLVLIAPLWN